MACPSDTEWSQLTNYIPGGSSTGGDNLKSCRQINSPLGRNCDTDVHPRWNDSQFYGTDDYGFSGFPEGVRDQYGNFYHVGNYANFWSSTEYFSIYSWLLYISCNSSDAVLGSYHKSVGLSVRCLKNN